MNNTNEDNDCSLLEFIAEVNSVGSLQKWINIRAAARGLSIGSPNPIDGELVKVMISSLSDDPMELQIIKDTMIERRNEIATARLDLVQVVPQKMVRDSRIDLGDHLMEIEVHCVLVPLAYKSVSTATDVPPEKPNDHKICEVLLARVTLADLDAIRNGGVIRKTVWSEPKETTVVDIALAGVTIPGRPRRR